MTRSHLMRKEYLETTRISGPLLFVKNASDLPYGSMVQILSGKGPPRNGQVIEVSEEVAVVQVLEQTMGLDLASTSVVLEDDEARLGVSEDMIGRRFNGLGRPLDGHGDIIPAARVPGSAVSRLATSRCMSTTARRTSRC